jgi:hypothetical protein
MSHITVAFDRVVHITLIAIESPGRHTINVAAVLTVMQLCQSINVWAELAFWRASRYAQRLCHLQPVIEAVKNALSVTVLHGGGGGPATLQGQTRISIVASRTVTSG